MRDTVQVTARGLCDVAGLAWFVYDWTLTLDDEIEYIWRRGFNLTTVLYTFARFLSFVFLAIGAIQGTALYHISTSQCSVFHWLEGIGTIIIVINSQVVLQYRLWALYNRNKVIASINGALFLVEVVAAAILCGVFYSKQERVILPPDVGESCLSIPQHDITFIFCGMLAYELWLAGLAVARAISSYSHLPVPVSGRRSLTEAVALGSIMYFILITSSVLVVIVIWFVAPLFPGNAAVAFLHAAGGIGSTRMILHIKREAGGQLWSVPSGASDLGLAVATRTDGIGLDFVRAPSSPLYRSHCLQ